MSQTKTQLIDGIVVDASGNVNIDSNTFYVDAANNRVGIGTTGPNNTIDVNGTGRFRLGGTNQLVFTTDGGNPYILSEQNAPLHFGTNSLLRATIDSSGNVGIGTSSPGGKLHIALTSSATTPIVNVGSFGVNGVVTLGSIANNSEQVYFGTGDVNGSGIAAGIGFLREAAGWNSSLAFYTNNVTSGPNGVSAIQEKMRITSGGLVGIGTTSPTSTLHVVGNQFLTSGNYFTDTTSGYFFNGAGGFAGGIFGSSAGNIANIVSPQTITLSTASSERARIDSSGNVGIGTTSPAALLDVKVASNAKLLVQDGNTTGNVKFNAVNNAVSANVNLEISASNTQFFNGGTERARIDSSGRLLVGTTSHATVGDTQYTYLQIQGGPSGSLWGGIGLTRNEAPTSITVDEAIGQIYFGANNGSPFASISCFADGTAGTNDYPGRLVFSTTADGASSPTERMRIGNDGGIYIQKTSGAMATKGVAIEPYATVRITTDSTGSDEVNFYLNRLSTDGALIKFLQANTEEGSISVSGTTVSYNGAHLSRWSQLPGGATREEILRGTLLSNLDEMCGWGEEDNEQLNRMKVSDVEGDKNVSGVFQAWDDDDDTYTNDFYCAMTGDFIIRIAEGITIDCGDLLMSAGDGTAKPQDDDIIRSKTVAKVTSTHVTCTYEDGSYCVPCVLMAC